MASYRWRDRARLLSWAIAAVVYAVVAAASVAAWMEPPRLGIRGDPLPNGSLHITYVHPASALWSAGVRAGNILLEVDQRPVDADRWLASGDAGTTFKVLDPRTEDTIEGSVADEGVISGVLTASLELAGLAFMVVGSLVYMGSRASPTVLAFAAMCFAGAIALAVAPADGQYQPWAKLVSSVSVNWVPTFFLGFFFLFSRSLSGSLSRYFPLPLLSGALALALNVLYVLAVTRVDSIFTIARLGALAHLALGLLLGVALLLRSYQSISSLVDRERLRVMVMGTALSIVPFAVFSILPSVVSVSPLVRPEVSVLGVVLIPLSFAYAIMRHQLLEIRRLVHRGVAYFMISAAVLVLYGLTVAGLRVVGEEQLASSALAQSLLLIVLFAGATLISGLRRAAFGFVDSVLYNDFTDYRGLHRRITEDAAAATTFGPFADRVLSLLSREFRLSFAAYISLERDGDTPRMLAGHLPERARAELPKLRSTADGVSSSPTAIDVPDTGVMTCLRVDGRSSGPSYLCLGPKVTEESLTSEDKEALTAITAQLATSFENLDLLDELRIKRDELRELNSRLVETQEAERAEIAAHIHDEPLQKVTYALWQLQDQDASPDTIRLLQEAVEALRTFTVLLHPAVLEDLGLVRALEWLVSETGERSLFTVSLEIEGIGRDDRFDGDTELGLYRIAQEALTNCQKHSAANRVSVRLEMTTSNLVLAVEDDGIGIRSKDSSNRSPRLGIAGMQERAAHLGGQVSISARTPSGTRVAADVPLPQIRRSGVPPKMTDVTT